MAKGSIYYAKITLKYKSGVSKATRTSTMKTSCVGYDLDDALERIRLKPDALASRMKKTLGKIRDVEVLDLNVLHESGFTMYDIETGKTLK